MNDELEIIGEFQSDNSTIHNSLWMVVFEYKLFR